MSGGSKDYSNVTNIVGPITIRPALVADADAIARVRVESWRASYRGIVPDAYLDGMKTEDSSRLWVRVLGAASDAACTYVVEVDGELVGFAAGITLAEPRLGFDAELTALYLLPAVQRAGIGRRLLAQVAATLSAAGAPNMLVWVLAQNRKARDFFEGLSAQLLAEQSFNWDDLDLVEVAYGWPEIASLVAPGAPSLAQ